MSIFYPLYSAPLISLTLRLSISLSFLDLLTLRFLMNRITHVVTLNSFWSLLNFLMSITLQIFLSATVTAVKTATFLLSTPMSVEFSSCKPFGQSSSPFANRDSPSHHSLLSIKRLVVTPWSLNRLSLVLQVRHLTL